MNILHITTQKPNSTGSGVYMCGMINGFKKLGYNQAVIAGIDKEDNTTFDKDISYYPVKYNTDKLDFDVVGMSDIMPYKSTKYRDLNTDMVNKLKNAFEHNIKKAIDEFKPDLIICHHLYLLTAFIREIVKDIKVVGICHGTCLRQLNSHDLEKEYIIDNIKKLDLVYALHKEQRKEIIDLFDIEESKVLVLGSGYDEKMFYTDTNRLENDIINITYAGKVCRAKGLESFIKSLKYLNLDKNKLKINIVGDGNDKEEYQEIFKLATKSNYNINFLGKIEQKKLSSLFRKSHIFVLPSFYEGLPLVVIEALASGCNVVTTDILGVKDWIGKDINESLKIQYINLPRMKSIGVPFKEDLESFEKDISNSIDNTINNIIKYDTRNKTINMSDKTWLGVCNMIIKGDVK